MIEFLRNFIFLKYETQLLESFDWEQDEVDNLLDEISNLIQAAPENINSLQDYIIDNFEHLSSEQIYIIKEVINELLNSFHGSRPDFGEDDLLMN